MLLSQFDYPVHTRDTLKSGKYPEMTVFEVCSGVYPSGPGGDHPPSCPEGNYHLVNMSQHLQACDNC